MKEGGNGRRQLYRYKLFTRTSSYEGVEVVRRLIPPLAKLLSVAVAIVVPLIAPLIVVPFTVSFSVYQLPAV